MSQSAPLAPQAWPGAPKSYQNGGHGCQNTAPGSSKWRPRVSKYSPGSRKYAPKITLGKMKSDRPHGPRKGTQGCPNTARGSQKYAPRITTCESYMFFKGRRQCSAHQYVCIYTPAPCGRPDCEGVWHSPVTILPLSSHQSQF